MPGTARTTEDERGDRLDVVVSRRAGVSRSQAQKMIGEGLVTVDGLPARKNRHLSPGEQVSWELPECRNGATEPEDLPVSIVYEDDHLVVVDKVADMVMYPGPGHDSGTLLNALVSRYPDIGGVGEEGRPGVVHRLDRGTSGLVAVARTEPAYHAMVELMRSRKVTRIYSALVSGSVPARTGTIDAPMARSRKDRKKMAVDACAGRPAVSTFEVKERFQAGFTLVEVRLHTGRTHQIRVHFSHIGHPVAGDPVYSRCRASRRLGLGRQFLHAHRLSFDHPFTGEALEFESALPDDLEAVLVSLRERG